MQLVKYFQQAGFAGALHSSLRQQERIMNSYGLVAVEEERLRGGDADDSLGRCQCRYESGVAQVAADSCG